MTVETSVESHYHVENLNRSIAEALERAGKHLNRLTVEDLAPVDEFHTRGRDATRELAVRAEITAGASVLDIGCGLGGTARYLAAEYGCRVTGIDLTRAYCAVAGELSARTGLDHLTKFEQGSALDLPFHDGSFDVVWTEHVQMNIADKRTFYAQACRTLKPGGKLAFHDIFQGDGGDVLFPVPWAATPDMSFLAAPSVARSILQGLGMAELQWIDTSDSSAAWFEAALERNEKHGPPPLGLHLLMGATGKQKFMNLRQSLIDGRVKTIQAVLVKSPASTTTTKPRKTS